MRVGVIGTGVVGRRVARELVDLAEVDAVVLLAARSKATLRLCDSLGTKVSLGAGASGATELPESLDAADVDVVILCTPDETQLDAARLVLSAGRNVVCTADATDTVQALLGLDEFARDVGRTVVVAAAMTPGWSAILARHAADVLDHVDEVAVAITGTAGAACVNRRTQAIRTDTQEWRDGAWVECAARSGPELVWFPDPLGAVDCARGDLSEGVVLHRMMPEVPVIVVKAGRPTGRPRPRWLRRLRPEQPGTSSGETGALRVAVSGRSDGQPTTIVYGLLGTSASSSAVLIAACVVEMADQAPGSVLSAEVIEPVRALSFARDRGVRCLVYDGID